MSGVGFREATGVIESSLAEPGYRVLGRPSHLRHAALA